MPKTYNQAKKKSEKYLYYKDREKLGYEVKNVLDEISTLKSRMRSEIGEIVTRQELKDITAEYNDVYCKYRKLLKIKNKLKIEDQFDLDYSYSLDHIERSYDDLVKLREYHITEFFNVFTDSTKRNTLGKLLLHEYVGLTGVCLLNATNASLAIACKHYINPSIPLTVVLTGINVKSLSTKHRLYKNNYEKGKEIINRDDDTKDEYKEYCLRRKIKNLSI